MANPSGGPTPYSYQWYSGVFSTCSGDSAIAGQVSQTYVAAPTVNTYYCYSVTDYSVPTQTATPLTVVVLVDSPLVAGSASPATPVMD